MVGRFSGVSVFDRRVNKFAIGKSGQEQPASCIGHGHIVHREASPSDFLLHIFCERGDRFGFVLGQRQDAAVIRKAGAGELELVQKTLRFVELCQQPQRQKRDVFPVGVASLGGEDQPWRLVYAQPVMEPLPS